MAFPFAGWGFRVFLLATRFSLLASGPPRDAAGVAVLSGVEQGAEDHVVGAVDREAFAGLAADLLGLVGVEEELVDAPGAVELSEAVERGGADRAGVGRRVFDGAAGGHGISGLLSLRGRRGRRTGRGP